MKRLILASLVMVMFSGAAFSQNNGGYLDDVYYNGTQAEQDAKAEAKKQNKQQQIQDDNPEYYNSSAGNGNNYDGNAQVYNNDYYGNDNESYIDYDDDSYTTRMRRFYYPMAGTGYWGGIYSPFWNSPFYANPYYGWGGWYTPGFSVSMGWGGGPYWNNCWGMNAWYGYGGFNSWYTPFGGFGGWGGYGAGFWNGYYTGLYDGGRYNNSYGRNPAVYGPRGGTRNGMLSVGSYGRNARVQATERGSGMMQPLRGGAANNNATIQRNNARLDRNSATSVDRSGFQTIEGRRNVGRNEAIRLNDSREINASQNATGVQQIERAPNRGGFFNSRNNNMEPRPVMQRSNEQGSPAPSRMNYNNVERSNSQPVQRYAPSNQAPSRSFSSPAPSRSGGFGGGSGGGGARMSGGRR